MSVVRQDNRIKFSGQYRDSELHAPLACIHHAVHDHGYRDFILDFSDCTLAHSGAMLALCAAVLNLRSERVDCELILPSSPELSRLFVNTNWASMLEPRKYDKSTFKGYTQVPATLYTNPTEQNDAVNRIINAILGGIPDIRRTDFAALEWAISELTDNVIVHSQSQIGGIVQVSNFKKSSKIVEFAIVDAGLGIPESLRSGNHFSGSDTNALDQAIREGVTRDKTIGQGNGLFGSYQICSHSGGSFQIESGHAKLLYRPGPYGLEIRDQKVPVQGTLIIAQINFTNPELLAEALQFAGKKYTPVDFIETHYEQFESDIIEFKLIEESTSFGSRVAGTPINIKLHNLIQMCPNQPIRVDFQGIPLISSSFADEVFGKLFLKLGAISFMQRIRFVNVQPTVQSLIDKAIAQRLSANQ